MPRCLSPADSCNQTSPHAAVAVVHTMLAPLVQVVHLAGESTFSEFPNTLAASSHPLASGQLYGNLFRTF